MQVGILNYNTGVGNETIEGTEEQAKAKADEGIVYTQQDVVIESEDGEKYIRRWYGCTASEEDECNDIIKFGNFGFYDEWTEY